MPTDDEIEAAAKALTCGFEVKLNDRLAAKAALTAAEKVRIQKAAMAREAAFEYDEFREARTQPCPVCDGRGGWRGCVGCGKAKKPETGHKPETDNGPDISPLPIPDEAVDAGAAALRANRPNEPWPIADSRSRRALTAALPHLEAAWREKEPGTPSVRQAFIDGMKVGRDATWASEAAIRDEAIKAEFRAIGAERDKWQKRFDQCDLEAERHAYEAEARIKELEGLYEGAQAEILALNAIDEGEQ
jgi:hypothetical protein